MKESKFTWIVANVIDKKTGKPFGNAPAYVIREFEGVKVGIFGLTLEETKTTSRPGPDVEFLNPCETARKIVAEIHAQGVKTVVALTHLSMSEDKEVARCSDVDVIIGGHEHTLLESSSGGAPIFKMTADARELGQIDLNISKSTGAVESIDWKVTPVTDKVKNDPQFVAINNKYGALLKDLSRVVGRTTLRTGRQKRSWADAGNQHGKSHCRFLSPGDRRRCGTYEWRIDSRGRDDSPRPFDKEGCIVNPSL